MQLSSFIISLFGYVLSEPLENVLFQLGTRHVARRCTPSQWPVVGDVLFFIFEQGLGEDFTPKLREAWTTMYNFLSYHMIRGLLSKQPSLALSESKSTVPKAKAGVCPYSGISTSDSTHNPEPKSIPESTSVQDEFDVMTPISHSSISFEMVNMVIESWDKVQKIPNWLELTGEMFMRKAFEICPETKDMFGFPGARFDDPDLSKNKKFMAKGVRLIRAVDMAVSFLGPDLEPLEQTLFQLGKRHVARKCKPRHWNVVGEILFYIFEQGLGDDFTPDLRKAWTILYNFLRYVTLFGINFKHYCTTYIEG